MSGMRLKARLAPTLSAAAIGVALAVGACEAPGVKAESASPESSATPPPSTSAGSAVTAAPVEASSSEAPPPALSASSAKPPPSSAHPGQGGSITQELSKLDLELLIGDPSAMPAPSAPPPGSSAPAARPESRPAASR